MIAQNILRTAASFQILRIYRSFFEGFYHFHQFSRFSRYNISFPSYPRFSIVEATLTKLAEKLIFAKFFENFDKVHFYLKLMSAIFYQILIFSPNDSPLKTVKLFLLHRETLFVLEIFKFLKVFRSFPHFPDSKGQMGVE